MKRPLSPDRIEPVVRHEVGGDGPADDFVPVAITDSGGVSAVTSDSEGIWFALGALLRARWMVVGVTTFVAVAAIAISLSLPNLYAATVRVLPPESGGSSPITAALMRGAGSAAAALLGGGQSDYSRYLSILSSRRVLEGMVDEFDLATVYDVQDKPAPKDAALLLLEENISFPVHETYDYLSVVVVDRDPRRAAQMANYAVARLNDINMELSSSNAASFSRVIEKRYEEAQMALDSVMNAGQSFQRRYGILDLDVQTQAYFTQLAEARAQVAAAEIQYDALNSQLGPENTDVQVLGEIVAASNAKVRAMMNGGEATLPVPLSEMSSVARQYADLKREGEVQRQILEVVQPLVEQARFDQEKRVEAVQVVDAAIPPSKKDSPSRAIIVITATLSGFLLSCLFAVALAAWRRKAPYVSERLRASGPVR